MDSVKLAKILSETAKSKGITQKILIQVNIAEEKQKYGFTVNEIKKQFGEIMGLDSLLIVGLMTMAPFTADKNILLYCVGKLKKEKIFLIIKKLVEIIKS